MPPSYNKNQKYPLVLWLHGAGGGGTDNLAQISGDQVSGTRVWTTARNQEDHPTFVLVPQVRGASWDGLIEGPNSALIQLLDSVSSEFSIDATRVYAAGQSMGGRGVWDLVRSEPDRFAAAIILCPELRSFGRVDRLGKLPVWVFDGGKDGPTFQEMSQSIVAALRAAGGVPRLTIYPDLGHEIWTRVFQEPELVPWLFAQRRR